MSSDLPQAGNCWKPSRKFIFQSRIRRLYNKLFHIQYNLASVLRYNQGLRGEQCSDHFQMKY